MKADIKTLKGSLKLSVEAFRESRDRAEEIVEFYHNNQLDDLAMSVIREKRQPAETYNIIKGYSRLLMGYFGYTVNTVKVSPQQENDVYVAHVLEKMVDYVMRDNHMETEGDKIKLDGLLYGLMCSFQIPTDTGERDRYGRPIYRIIIQHVPAREIYLDPQSRLVDYEDARFIHRAKWVDRNELKKLFTGETAHAAIDAIPAYTNNTTDEYNEHDYNYDNRYTQYMPDVEPCLLIHTIITDDDDKTWSIYWGGDNIIEKVDITSKKTQSPYRVQKIHYSSKAEYYGIFREAIETQKAINQAVIKIQNASNSKYVIYQKGSIENVKKFEQQVGRVDSIIEVLDKDGVEIKTLDTDIQNAQRIIDNALERIHRVLGINPSFLGLAPASDSGRKVKLQQNQAIMALRYILTGFEQYYRLLGHDLVAYIGEYYKAEQVVKVADDRAGFIWMSLNEPLLDENGQPTYYEVEDPDNPGKPLLDNDNNLVYAPLTTAESEVAFVKTDIIVDTVPFNDSDEQAQNFIEEVLNGPTGQYIAQFKPASFFRLSAIAVDMQKSSRSKDISEVLNTIADELEQTGQQLPDPTGAKQTSGASGSVGNRPSAEE